MSLFFPARLDLGSVEQGCDDRCRADADREARLHELGTPLVGLLVVITHIRSLIPLLDALSMKPIPLWEGAR